MSAHCGGVSLFFVRHLEWGYCCAPAEKRGGGRQAERVGTRLQQVAGWR